MNAATKLMTAVETGMSEIFMPRAKSPEPDEPFNSYQDAYDYYQEKITKSLNKDRFYALDFPTELNDSIGIDDIFDAIYNDPSADAMNRRMMTTNNEFDVIGLRRTTLELAIDALSREWATTEASSRGDK